MFHYFADNLSSYVYGIDMNAYYVYFTGLNNFIIMADILAKIFVHYSLKMLIKSVNIEDKDMADVILQEAT